MNVKVSLNRMLAFSVIAALLTVSIFAMSAATTYAQTTGEGAAGGTTDTGTTTSTTPTDQGATTTTGGTPLTFTLRTGDGAAAAGGGAAAAPTTAGNDTTRNISITVNIARGNEPPIQLPINATIPANTNSLDLCVSAMDIPETCQPVWSANATNANATAAGTTPPTIDLTQNATSGGTAAAPTTTTPTTPEAPTTATPSSSYAPTMTTTPSLFYTAAATGISSSSSSVGRFIPVSGSLIGIEDTTVFVPVTVIAPITLQIQNAQVCAQLLSSGDQTCNQIILNPEQTSFTPVDVDLASPTPTVTSEGAETTTTGTTTTPTQEPTTDTTGAGTPTPTEEPTTPTEGEEGGTTGG